MHAAGDFQLPRLVKLSEERLVTLTTLENCFAMYSVAAGAKASILLAQAAKIIADNWDRFTADDFKVSEIFLVSQVNVLPLLKLGIV